MAKRMKSVLSVLAVCGVVFAGSAFAVHAQEREHRGPTLVSPENGTTVANPVTVAFGFGGGEGRPSEHEGGEHRGHGPHVFLLVDAPAPEQGAPVQADAAHLPFPEGQRQTTVTLAPGQHVLQLVVVDREGRVSRRAQPAAPVTVTVQ